jgi:DNA-binding response OmpR family regulator
MPAPGQPTLLVVDDDASIREFVGLTLRLGGYHVVFASDGQEVPDLVAHAQPRMLVMDISMPGLSGIDALRRLRDLGNDVPVIMLTARGADDDKLTAFEAGADDYLTKPFSAKELVARVGALLRRAKLAATEPPPSTVITVGPLTLEPGTHSARMSDRELGLTRTEYALLLTLARQPGRVFTPAELLTRVWGLEYRDQAEILRTTIYRLRQKLEDDPRQPRHLCNRAGVGYYFSPD